MRKQTSRPGRLDIGLAMLLCTGAILSFSLLAVFLVSVAVNLLTFVRWARHADVPQAGMTALNFFIWTVGGVTGGLLLMASSSEPAFMVVFLSCAVAAFYSGWVAASTWSLKLFSRPGAQD